MTRSFKTTTLTAAILASFLLVPSSVAAQSDVGMARYGQRFLTAGYASQPGLVRFDESPGVEYGDSAVSWGNFVKLGLHHMLRPRFAMSGEIDLGLHYMDEHTIALDGLGKKEHALSWQIGMMGRFIPRGDLSGTTLGMGMHLLHVGLEQAPLRSLDLEFRLGHMLWRGDREPRFALIEIGSSLPITRDLKYPTEYAFLGEDAPEVAPRNWSWLRATIALQVAF